MQVLQLVIWRELARVASCQLSPNAIFAGVLVSGWRTVTASASFCDIVVGSPRAVQIVIVVLN